MATARTGHGKVLHRLTFDTYLSWHRTPGRGQADKRGFKTNRDAEAFANSVEVTKARGEYVAPSLGRITLAGGVGGRECESRATDAGGTPARR